MTSLPRSTPADQHVDPAAILRFLDVVDGRPDIEMHSLMVVRHGQVIAEGWWAPYSADRPQLLYSLSKSFTSTAAAFAQAEGMFDLDDPVVSHFPEFEADITDPRSRAMKIRHVASMASGHTGETLGEAMARDPGDLVRGFLLTPPDREPGTVFAYNQPCTYTLASIVQRHAGMPMTEYLRPRLFDPLGIGQVGWQARPAGRELGFTGLHARTEDIAKLGQLYLQRGKWDGVQLIPETWVEAATSKQVDNPDGFELDWSQGYGFQFWMARHGYRGDGAFGQFCVVLPEHDTVVAATAYTWQMQMVLDAMWEHLLPGLGAAAPENGPAQEKLSARLGGLALPACEAAGAPADWSAWAGQPFTVAASSAQDTDKDTGIVFGTEVKPTLTAVRAAPAADGWQISLVERSNELTLPVGSGTWAVSSPADSSGDTIPVAASGGWLDDHTLRAEIIFLETPHRMDITCSLPERGATAVWRHPPLTKSKLRDLRSPV